MGGAYERISNMTCYLSSSLISMHFGHGTMSQIICIKVVFFRRALPQERRLFCEKFGPLLPHYEDFFIF